MNKRPLYQTVLSYVAVWTWSLVVLVPLLWTLVTSFKTRADIFNGPKYLPFVQFQPVMDAWTRFFVTDWRYFSAQYLNSVVIGLASSVLAVTVGSLAAYGLVRFRYVWRNKLRNREIAFWFVSQRILPPVAIVVPLFVLFQATKLFDTQFGLILAYTAFNLPLVVWLMQDYFAGIPVELEESAY
ncbi:MAG: carbohydrate ABC transporter permease, partial [Pseudopedobacter sp.]|nr:carbohydrate ABC transporter permease [Deinococcales bacterium]